VGADEAARGFEADDVVEAGGHAAGAGGVGAEGEVDFAAGDDDGGAGAGAATDEGRVEGVGDGAVGGAGAVEAAGKLVEVGFTVEGGTSIEQALHHGGVRGGGTREGGAGGGGGPALHVDVVLDGEAQGCERAFFSGPQRLVWPVEPGVGVGFDLHHVETSHLGYKM